MSDSPARRVVATAGHVDHGKSTLVRALTGMEPDRYEEERRRGLTLDLGFVWTTLPSGRGIAFVDVPGHARLVRTMLAGVGTVDLCLLVVAATEGWMPQSEEHLRILELVGATDGVVALTKIGAVDDDRRLEAHAALEARLDGTFLEGKPIVAVDAVDGTGLDALRAALDDLVARPEPPAGNDRPRLWVDRAFSIKGAGAVVTGTLGGGDVHVGDALVAVNSHGRRFDVRVRSLQSQEQPRDVVGPGARVAVNVSGATHHDLGRGTVLVRDAQWQPTACFDALVRTLPDAELRTKGALLAYVGTGEQSVRVRVLEGRDHLGPGEQGTARLWLPRPVPVLPGDRFVLRDTGRGVTVGGGEVLDVQPVLPVGTARPDRDVARLVAERGWTEVDELERLTGERRAATLGRWVVSEAAIDLARERALARVDAADQFGAELAHFDDHERAVLASIEELVVERGRVRRRTDEPPVVDHPWLRALDAAPFSPPSPDGVPRAEVRDLVQRGLVVHGDGIYFSLTALEQARQRIADALVGRAGGLAMSELRDLFATSRKYAMPLTALLDKRGVTIRRDDLRLAGPRIAQPLSPRPL